MKASSEPESHQGRISPDSVWTSWCALSCQPLTAHSMPACQERPQVLIALLVPPWAWRQKSHCLKKPDRYPPHRDWQIHSPCVNVAERNAVSPSVHSNSLSDVEVPRDSESLTLTSYVVECWEKLQSFYFMIWVYYFKKIEPYILSVKRKTVCGFRNLFFSLQWTLPRIWVVFLSLPQHFPGNELFSPLHKYRELWTRNQCWTDHWKWHSNFQLFQNKNSIYGN